MTRLIQRQAADPYGNTFTVFLTEEESASLAPGSQLALTGANGHEAEFDATEVTDAITSALASLAWPSDGVRNPAEQLHDLGYRHPQLNAEQNLAALEHVYQEYRGDRAAFNRTVRHNGFVQTEEPVTVDEQDVLRDVFRVDPHEAVSERAIDVLGINPVDFPGGPTYGDLTDDELQQLATTHPVVGAPLTLNALSRDDRIAVFHDLLEPRWHEERLVTANRLSLEGWRHPQLPWDDQQANRSAIEEALVPAETIQQAAESLVSVGFVQDGKRSL